MRAPRSFAILAPGVLWLTACGGGGGGGAAAIPAPRLLIGDLTLTAPDRSGRLEFALAGEPTAKIPALLQWEVAYDPDLLTTDASVEALQPVTIAAHVVRPGLLRIVLGDATTGDGSAAAVPGPLLRLPIAATPGAPPTTTPIQVGAARGAAADGSATAFEESAPAATVRIP